MDAEITETLKLEKKMEAFRYILIYHKHKRIRKKNFNDVLLLNS